MKLVCLRCGGEAGRQPFLVVPFLPGGLPSAASTSDLSRPSPNGRCRG